MRSIDIVVASVLVVALLLLVATLPLLKEEEATASPDLATVLDAYLSSGPDTFITSEALFANLNDGFSGNDPYVICVEGQVTGNGSSLGADYALAHIPGAVLHTPATLFSRENLSALPVDRQLVIYDTYGQLSPQFSALLGALGFDAVSLLWGLASWTTNPGIISGPYDRDSDSRDYPLETSEQQPQTRSGGAGCGEISEDASQPDPIADDALLQGAIASYIAKGVFAPMSSDQLYGLISSPGQNETPYLLDVRSAEEYQKGHIPGAVNLKLADLFEEDALASLPDDRKIVAICDLGRSAGMAAALLGVLGYEASALEWGMASWTRNDTVSSAWFDKTRDSHNFPLYKGAQPGSLSSAFVGDVGEVVRQAALEYLGSGRSTYISAEALYSNLADNYPGNDPMILSLNGNATYLKGHIPGAINIQPATMFTEQNLSLIPKNRQIVVYCPSGHLDSQVVALLNLLGYQAVALKWGINSWTKDPAVALDHFQTLSRHDYPTESETQPGARAGTRSGCLEDMDIMLGSVEPTGSNYEVLQPLADALMRLGRPADYDAFKLHLQITSDTASERPFVISLQSPAQYRLGHIPGAVNMDILEMFRDGGLDNVPKTREVVVVCETGRTASQVAAVLSLMGYDALPLKWGMASWTMNTTLAPVAFDRDADARDLPLVPGSLPGKLTISTVSKEELVRAATYDYLLSGQPTMMTGKALFENLNDRFSGNDPYILSLTTQEEYLLGHIPGAISWSPEDIFTKAGLSRLPMKKQIVVYGNSSHEPAQIASLLSVLGYQAVYLEWGICSWTQDPAIAFGAYQHATDSNDLPLVAGNLMGEMPTRAGCEEDIAETPSQTPIANTEAVRSSCEDYLTQGLPATISAPDLYAWTTDPARKPYPCIVDLRDLSDYEKGHIPGAMNKETADLFTPEGISTMSVNKNVVTVCYLGNKASRAAALLNLNGIDAVALEWGMASWTTNKTVAPDHFDPVQDSNDYPVISGSDPGNISLAPIDENKIILTHVRQLMAGAMTPTVTATALYANLADGLASNDPYIICLTDQKQYETGHIPGAVNMPVSSIFTEEGIAGLPTTRQIVVYCHTGHTSGQVATLLSLMGFNAVSLKWGIASWTTNTTVAPYFFDDASSKDYHFATGPKPGGWLRTREGCSEESQGSTTVSMDLTSVESEVLRKACYDYFASGATLTTTAKKLYDEYHGASQTGPPYVLDIRSKDYYEKGHIPGAMNIPFGGLFEENNLSAIPKDRAVVVACYLGITSSQAVPLLNILGFSAKVLEWGMTSWTKNVTVAPWRFQWGWDTGNLPLCTGPSQGDLKSAAAMGVTKEEIILKASRTYAGMGCPTMEADTVSTLIYDLDTSDDPFIIFIGNTSDYLRGHVPGALHMPWEGLFSSENLSLIPKGTRKVIVVDNDGQMAGQVVALLYVLGYNAFGLKYGMSSWTTNTTIAPSAFNKTKDQASYPVATGYGSRGTRECEEENKDNPGFRGTTYEWELMRQSAEAYIKSLKATYLTSKALYNNLFDDYAPNDPVVIDIRDHAEYGRAHIPGAVLMPLADLFSEENMQYLDGRDVVIYCSMGQKSGGPAALLGLNGHRATHLNFGFCSWTDNATALGGGCFDPALDSFDLRVSVGPDPGTWASAKTYG